MLDLATIVVPVSGISLWLARKRSLSPRAAAVPSGACGAALEPAE